MTIVETKKIKGITINFFENDIAIIDSYKIKNPAKMLIILQEGLEKSEEFEIKNIPNSFINKWLTHNNLYKLHLFRKHNKDVILNKNDNNKLKNFCYIILSFPNKVIYKIKDIKRNIQINKKTKLYKKYIKEHKANIEKAYEEMSNIPEIYQIGGDDLLNKLYNRVLVHDDSKYSKEEFEPYRKNFFPINQQEKEDNKNAFNAAWEHHFRNNSHHWQYRQNKTSFNSKDDEQILDVLENVLDWMAMGYKFNDRPYQYYIKNQDHIILNEDERKFLEHIIFDCVDKDYLITASKYVTKEELNERINKSHGRRKKDK